MSPRSIHPIWKRLVPALFLAASPLLHAGDKPPAVPEGYKEVKLPGGGAILVKENSDPFKRLSSAKTQSEKYDPTQLFNHESSIAHKQFDASSGPMTAKDFNPHDKDKFLTKAYSEVSASDRTKSDFYTKFPLAGNTDTHAASDLNKTYSTSSIGRSMPKFGTSSSSFQGQTATLPDNKQETFAYNQADKQYLGPGAQKVPEGIDVKQNVVIARLGDLPNRPLTVDEVRDLINHGIKPDTQAEPDMPTKALNDPDYKPEPLRDMPAAGQDDKDAPVPPPGTISNPPENSEPLPQH